MPICSACGFLAMENEGVKVFERWLCLWCVFKAGKQFLEEEWEALERALNNWVAEGGGQDG